MDSVKLAKTINSAIGYYTVKNFIKLKKYQLNARKYISMMPFVYDEISTLKEIADKNCSVARYGDGELGICMGEGIRFQEYDGKLSQRLKEILVDESVENLLVCLAPHTNSYYTVTPRVRTFIYKFFARRKESYVKLLNPDRKYGSTFISRPDAFLFEAGQLEQYRELLRRLWDKRDVLVVTGKGSRFSLDEELFDNIKSSEVIYGLPENAFREYNDILERIKTHSRDKLILLAMGPAATVLAYDLAKEKYQAIDLGHLPSCYQIAKSDSRPFKTGY
jgi:glycosyltransferase family protein